MHILAQKFSGSLFSMLDDVVNTIHVHHVNLDRYRREESYKNVGQK